MTDPLPGPSAAGVRTAGDRFQWLVAWLGCVRVLLDSTNNVDNPIIAIGVEVAEAGNLDDVVQFRSEPPNTYQQIKYTVDGRTPLNLAYLAEPSSFGGPSILAKVADSWRRLTASGEPVRLTLVSNRQPDPDDVLIAGRDSRSRLLLPKAAASGRAIAAARQLWAAAANLDEEQLLALLRVLDFDIGRDVGHMSEEARYAMAAAGLRSDELALNAGIDWMARQVVAGSRRLDLSDIQGAVATEALQSEDTRMIVSVATLKPDPMASDAAYSIDWVDRFEGEGPSLKRRPESPATWAQLQEAIEVIPAHLPAGSRVTVTGSFRLAPAFAIGATLRAVTGFEVATVQRGVLWRSDDASGPPITLSAVETEIGHGEDLAIAVEIATPLASDVLAFIRSQDLPVSRLVVLRPHDGPRNNFVDGPTTACRLAEGIRDSARRAVRGHPRVHLFLATPMGLAMLLGHRWNRIAPAIVYEDLVQNGYEAAFCVIS